jgi:chromate reductase
MKTVLKDLPCVVITSSPAGTGGVRAQEQLHKTLLACLSQLVPTPQVCIPKVHEKISNGRLTDEASLEMAVKAVESLVEWVRNRDRVTV